MQRPIAKARFPGRNSGRGCTRKVVTHVAAVNAVYSLSKTSVVLVICKNGSEMGDQNAEIVKGASRAMWRRNTTDRGLRADIFDLSSS